MSCLFLTLGQKARPDTNGCMLRLYPRTDTVGPFSFRARIIPAVVFA